MSVCEEVTVAAASGSDDLIPTLIEEMRRICPDLPLYVISEFQVDGAWWIPYHPGRTLEQNLALCQSALKGKRVRFVGLILQPRMPYWRLRWLAFRLGGARTIFFNEQLHHFMLRPRSLGTIARHFLWRGGNLLRWELKPGGTLYTLAWRLRHPRAFARPLRALQARMVGWMIRWRKAMTTPRPLPSAAMTWEPGISVVVPSRNGRDLLARLLPGLLDQLNEFPHEVIVVDNGSDDGSAEFLRIDFPAVRVLAERQPMSFSAAVNRGIAAARYNRLLMLNNDMVLEPGFFRPLLTVFDTVPDLFCATAQILFPEGVRREETGKAVMPVKRPLQDFPLTCDLPLEGEDGSYVLYGSGGCSLFDTEKLVRVGALDEEYSPAYVEDLDLGVRGWQQGWPTVFVAQAKVEHRHRATTSRYFTPQELDRVLEVNYLKFLVRTINDPDCFGLLWGRAIDRLNGRAAAMSPDQAATAALATVGKAPEWIRPVNQSALTDAEIFAAGAGDAVSFPGVPPTGRPVILVASPYLPFPLSHGGAVRMYNLLKQAQAGFDLVLLCFTDQFEAPAREVRELCTETVIVRRHASHLRPLGERPTVVDEFDSLTFRTVLKLLVKKWRPGVAQLEFTQLAQYADACHPAKTVLVEHDITLDLYKQLMSTTPNWETEQQYVRWVRFEEAAWRQVDAVVAMSEKDRRTVGLDSAVTLVNGVDLSRFQPSSAEPEPDRMLFIGSFAHLPNVLAVDFFLRQVWPAVRERAPHAVLHLITGSRPEYFLDLYKDRVQPPLAQPGIEWESFVSDPRPAYHRASVVIAPLLASAGTNIKIMEAMAMGRAIVSTRAGINGLDDLVPGRDLLVSDDPAGFAEAINRLLSDADLRRSIEKSARATVTERYGWEAVGARQRDLYRRLMAASSSSSAPAKK